MMDQKPSLAYQRRSQWLFERYRRKEISAQEYEDQLQQAEEQAHVQTGMAQLKQTLQQYETDQRVALERQQKEQEEKRRLTEQREQQRLSAEKRMEEERLRQAEEQRKEEERKELERAMQPFLEYRDIEVPAVMEEMQKRARHSRWFSIIFQLAIIATSTIAAGIVNIENIPRVVTSVLTIIVAITTGVVWIFKFKEKSINSQQTADAIEYQRNLYRLGIKDYAGITPKEAHELFAERVEDLKNEQNKRQQLLEQTSDKPTEGIGAPKPV